MLSIDTVSPKKTQSKAKGVLVNYVSQWKSSYANERNHQAMNYLYAIFVLHYLLYILPNTHGR